MRLDETFYHLPTRQLAKSLLGKVIARQVPGTKELRGIIVEVEAYLSAGDPASHSQAGPSRKNQSMFSDPGTLYVYPIHSRHCMNIVSEPAGVGAAVLIRAIEPLTGLEDMRQLRRIEQQLSGVRDLVRLTRGPGRLCEAMDVDRRLDGVELATSRNLWLEQPPESFSRVAWKSRRSPRIGISKAKTLPLRWFIDGNQFVSGCAREHSAGRTWTFLNW